MAAARLLDQNFFARHRCITFVGKRRLLVGLGLFLDPAARSRHVGLACLLHFGVLGVSGEDLALGGPARNVFFEDRVAFSVGAEARVPVVAEKGCDAR